MPFRKAGNEFWPSIKKADEIKIQTENIKAQIRKVDEQLQQLCAEEQQLQDIALHEANKAAASDKDSNSAAVNATPVPEAPEHTQEQISELRNQFTN